MNFNQWQRLILIVGPTAVGKSHVAQGAAAKWSAGIINCDSLQVFRGLDVGTAKPTAKERAKVPHFLFDVADLGESYTAGRYRREALAVIEQNLKQMPLLLVGGSGFYIQALEKGMYDIPAVTASSRELVKRWLDEKGLDWAYQRLLQLDPIYAEKIGPTDRYRIFRALTVIEDSGKTPSQVQAEFLDKQKESPFPWRLEKVGLTAPRDWLRERVIMRAQHMVASGLESEVKELKRSLGESWAPLQSVGYKETLSYLRGELSREQWIDEIVTSTMKLAKRQMTWFRRDKEIRWFSVEKGFAEVTSYLDSLLVGNP